MDQGSGVSAAELVSLRIGVRASKFAVGDKLAAEFMPTLGWRWKACHPNVSALCPECV